MLISIYVQLISKAFTLAIVHTHRVFTGIVLKLLLLKNAVYRPCTRTELELILCEVAVRMKQTNVKANAAVNRLQKHQLTMKAVL